MAATYGKLSDVHRDWVWDLARARISYARIADLLAQGNDECDPPIAPVKISPQGVGVLVRKQKREREQLYTIDLKSVPTDQGLDLVLRRLVAIADHETKRLDRQQERGQLDAKQLGALAGAMKAVHQLAQLRAAPPAPRGKGDSSEVGEAGSAPSVAEQLLRGEQVETVPSDHRDQAQAAEQSGARGLAVVK